MENHSLFSHRQPQITWLYSIIRIADTGGFAMPVEQPRLWHYPAGYCTLGCGLPNGIGAKLALPEQPVVVLVGDGGFMFTVQELVTAADHSLEQQRPQANPGRHAAPLDPCGWRERSQSGFRRTRQSLQRQRCAGREQG